VRIRGTVVLVVSNSGKTAKLFAMTVTTLYHLL